MIPDAVLLQSFGGPDAPRDVAPFLANVVRGRQVPPSRLEQVASQYLSLGGASPLNDLNRRLASRVESVFARRDRFLPVYVGNRNWRPYLADTMREMVASGVRSAAVFTTSPYSSYSGCRQYIEDLEAAALQVGSGVPQMRRVGPYFDHPGFLDPLADGLAEASAQLPASVPVLMTAHSIPTAMAAACQYQSQLAFVAEEVAARAGVEGSRTRLVYQSRSGSPSHPWLGPDMSDAIDEAAADHDTVIVVPIGFVSDHMEVRYDIDVAGRERARSRGARLVRTPTPADDPRFAEMVFELVVRTASETTPRAWCGTGCCKAATP